MCADGAFGGTGIGDSRLTDHDVVLSDHLVVHEPVGVEDLQHLLGDDTDPEEGDLRRRAGPPSAPAWSPHAACLCTVMTVLTSPLTMRSGGSSKPGATMTFDLSERRGGQSDCQRPDAGRRAADIFLSWVSVMLDGVVSSALFIALGGERSAPRDASAGRTTFDICSRGCCKALRGSWTAPSEAGLTSGVLKWNLPTQLRWR